MSGSSNETGNKSKEILKNTIYNWISTKICLHENTFKFNLLKFLQRRWLVYKAHKLINCSPFLLVLFHFQKCICLFVYLLQIKTIFINSTQKCYIYETTAKSSQIKKKITELNKFKTKCNFFCSVLVREILKNLFLFFQTCVKIFKSDKFF